MNLADIQPGELDAIGAEAKAATGVLRLPFQNQIWKGQTGDFAGGGVGSSLDFQDHRAYAPGDDPRHINWQAYARTGHYSMKLYREEVRPLIDLVFDVSDSMFFEEEKRRRSLELFYFVIHAVQRAGASLATSIVKGDHHRRIREEGLLSHAWLEEAEALPPTGSAAPPDLQPLRLRGQSMRILISDLLFNGAPDHTLLRLSERKGRGMILCPFVDSESSPDWSGNYEFVDAESSTRHPHRVDSPLLKRYIAAYHRHFELWKEKSRKFDVLLAKVPGDLDFLEALRAEAMSLGAVGTWK